MTCHLCKLPLRSHSQQLRHIGRVLDRTRETLYETGDQETEILSDQALDVLCEIVTNLICQLRLSLCAECTTKQIRLIEDTRRLAS
jgi:hypothetical protein